MKNKLIIVGIVALVVGLAGGYLVGKRSAPQGQFGQLGQNGQGRFPGGRTGGTAGQIQSGGFITGNIISKTDNSVTIQSRDGSSKIVFFGSSAEVSKFVQGAVSDLATGETVTVAGTANSDGSINAQTIQIRPAMPVGTSTQPGR
jgi:hypothetical protein